MASKYTSICRKKLWFYRILDAILLLTPLIVYFCIALGNDGVAAQKVALVGCVIIALILTLINIVLQKHLRCPIWICLIGMYIAMREFLLPLIVILAVTSVLDDLFLSPIINHYKTALIANKEIDQRKVEGDL